MTKYLLSTLIIANIAFTADFFNEKKHFKPTLSNQEERLLLKHGIHSLLQSNRFKKKFMPKKEYVPSSRTPHSSPVAPVLKAPVKLPTILELK